MTQGGEDSPWVIVVADALMVRSPSAFRLAVQLWSGFTLVFRNGRVKGRKA